MRCLGYQQISRRLGREGCSTIRKCQLATSSFCRSLNPIFPTCISATGTGPSAGTAARRAQQEQCYGDPPAPAVPAPPDPRVPQAELAHRHQGRHGAGGGSSGGSSVDGHTELHNRGHTAGSQRVWHVWGRTQCVRRSRCSQGTPQVHRGVHGGHVRVEVCNFCVHGGEDAMWGAACAQRGRAWEVAEGPAGCVQASGQGSQEGGHGWCRLHGVSSGLWQGQGCAHEGLSEG